MTPEQLREASSYAVALANRAVREAASTNPECRNMGTTLVAAVSYEGGTVISNVGDSRAYHITEGGIVRVTKDHSLVESMVDRGDITAEEMLFEVIHGSDPDTCLGRLLEISKSRGAADNVTAVLMQKQ